MEASVSLGPPPRERAAQSRLLRLGTDDQLVAQFRKGFDEAFETIHDRYHAALFSYARQLLVHSNADAEDAVQEVFWRASRALRKDDREIVLRPWLYRIARNYCLDQLRRPEPQLCELYDVSRPPYRDPAVEAEQRESFRYLMADLERLPDQQRSALLMHIDGLRYVQIAAALGISPFAVKSGVNRARDNLRAANEAREAACEEIRADLDRAHARKVRMSGKARKHLTDCAACKTYKTDLRAVNRALNSIAPHPGSLAWFANLLGIGGAGSGAVAGGGAAAGGGSVAATTISVGATPIAAKVTALVCCAALAAAGAGAAGKDAARKPTTASPATAMQASTPEHRAAGRRPGHADPLGLAQAPFRAGPPPTRRARPVAPSRPAPGSSTATSPSSAFVLKPGTMTTHHARPIGPATPTTYTSTRDAAHQTGGAAAPDDGPATTTAPPARDEATPSGTPAEPDSGAAPEVQSVPVAPETNAKPQPPADSAPAAPASSQTAAATPAAASPAAPASSAPTGGTGASTAAVVASTTP